MIGLRGAVREAGEVVDRVAEVEIVDVLSVSLERAVLLAHTDPLGLGRCVRRQLEHVEHAPELVPSHVAVVGRIEVVEQRKQLDLSVFHLSTAQRVLLREYCIASRRCTVYGMQ